MIRKPFKSHFLNEKYNKMLKETTKTISMQIIEEKPQKAQFQGFQTDVNCNNFNGNRTRQSISTLSSATQLSHEQLSNKSFQIDCFNFTFCRQTKQYNTNHLSQTNLQNHFNSHQILNSILFSVIFNHIYLMNIYQALQWRLVKNIIIQTDYIISSLIKIIKNLKNQCSLMKIDVIKRFFKFIKHIKEQTPSNTQNLEQLIKMFDQSLFSLIFLGSLADEKPKKKLSNGFDEYTQRMIQLLCQKLGILVNLEKEGKIYTWGDKKSFTIFNLGYEKKGQQYYLQEIQYNAKDQK